MRRPRRPSDGKPIKHFFCGFDCKAAWQAKQHPVSDDWLYQRYVVDKMDCVQIAVIVDRDPKSVWTWITNAGIETRPRGSDARQLFKAGAPSKFLGRKHSEASKQKTREARLRDGHFPKDNGRPYWEGKTGKQHPSWRGGTTPERQAFYSSPEWRSACSAVWHRADAKCERCDRDSRDDKPKDRRFHVHHIVSFQVRELRATVSNLALLCAPCHRFVHGKLNIQREFLK